LFITHVATGILGIEIFENPSAERRQFSHCSDSISDKTSMAHPQSVFDVAEFDISTREFLLDEAKSVNGFHCLDGCMRPPCAPNY
jgi:hypothetical protein